MRFSKLIPLLATTLISTAVHAIFTDEAFQIDYHHALLGIPQSHTTFFHKPQSASNASLLYTLSDKAVLGAINPKDGVVLWRQTLSKTGRGDREETYLVAGEDGTVISAYGKEVRAWDALDGRLVWEYSMVGEERIKGLRTVPLIGGSAGNIVQDVIVLAGRTETSGTTSVMRVGGDGIGVKWEYKDSSAGYDSSVSVATSAKSVFYISKGTGILAGGKAKVVVLDITTGAEISQYSVAVDEEGFGADGSYVVGSCSDSPFLISSEKPYKSLKFNLLGNSKVSTLPLLEKGLDVLDLNVVHACNGQSTSRFLVHAKTESIQWAEVFNVNTKTGEVTKVYSLPATEEESAFAASTIGSTLYFTRITSNEIDVYSSESQTQLGRWPITKPAGTADLSPSHAAVEVSARGKSGLAVRVATTSSDGEWILLRNGEVQWTRPETLAYLTKAIWSEDADLTLFAQDIEAEASANPLSAYIHRVTRHIMDLAHLPQVLMGLPLTIFQPSDASSDATRRALVGGKLILAASSRQELFGIDAANGGTIKWRVDMSGEMIGNSQVVDLSVTDDRLTAYLSGGAIVVVNIVDGKLVQFQKGSASFNKIVELPGSPASTIVKVSADGTPEVFSDLAPSTPAEGNALVTINDKGEAVGWTIGSTVEKLWTIRPKSSAKIIQAIARPSNDPVASIGKVLGDRSVLYKYVSPNIALLTALSSSTLTVYLINAVTGTVLYTTTHEGVLTDLPTPSVMSENWFAYSFTTRDASTSGLYTQLIITELYESAHSNDRGLLSSQTNYSSFAPDAGVPPHAVTLAYTVAEPISNLTVSQTLQGITTRNVLAVLSNSNAIISIPRDSLNARRPVDRDPTALEMEEGLMKYFPILELDPKLLLTHTREVLGIQDLMSAPSLLESTSMIFAYGHDVFGTQLAPSETFDLLGKGFKRVQLILTVVALYLGVLALRPIVRKKMVERRWL